MVQTRLLEPWARINLDTFATEDKFDWGGWCEFTTWDVSYGHKGDHKKN